ncbi:hydroxysteroid 11-beta-dehydrogenase 1-like protein B [Rhineura floridana]|uniref:hydroxysteroid 11-beta-dehydrogenase 1-like protein B n=1 Tax=Rhineura floridana TaxID=261503 RepID=UPI002AC7E941|nr:hydroxysteroid 11-beta-dehydrogenase 1-like protein B [Rhineura floridana]
MAVLKLFASLLVGLCAYYFYSQETFSEEMVRGKRVLVTGSSTGIGEQMAYEFARMGAHVMVMARREERLQKVVQKCLDLGASSASYVVSDMSNLTSAQQVVEETKTVLGGLDLLVLNHIGSYGSFGPLQGDMEAMITTMTVNFFSYVQLTVSALSALQESHGSIVILSSMSGRIPSPFSVVCSATKFALEGFYSGLRLEMHLRKIDLPITVAVLGYIDTGTEVRAVDGSIAIQASPKEVCAREIVKSGVLRQQEVVCPYWVTKPILAFRDWILEVLEQMLTGSYKGDNIL